MALDFNIEKEPLIYFLLNKKDVDCKKTYKKDIVYIGASKVEKGKRFNQHPKKIFNKIKYISSRKLDFLNNKYFREYYELRWINNFNPTKYNKQKDKAPSLNLFLLKMFLWFENPNPFWISPLSSQCPFMKPKSSNGLYWLEHTYSPNNSRWVINGYTRVWETLDLNKKLYIDNQDAFKFLINEKTKPSLAGKLRKKFTPRKERLHNDKTN